MWATGKKRPRLESSLDKAGKSSSFNQPLLKGHRTKPREHIPKKHGDLENPIVHNKQYDVTADRIHGERRDDFLKTNNHEYGKAYNPADNLPKIGRRTEMLQAQVSILHNCQVHAEVAEELRLKKEKEDRMKEQRYFDSTAKTTFVE